MTSLCVTPLGQGYNRSRASVAARRIGRAALIALWDELCLYPKPGLVSLVDSGAHDDMDAGTFRRSIWSLRRYFTAIADAGAAGAPFEELQWLGQDAERRMLRATKGINTHRGAIFTLGLLAAAAGFESARERPLSAGALAETVVRQWGEGIAAAGRQSSDSHGSRAVRRYGARGARDEVLDGLPTLTALGLAPLRATRSSLGCPERARVQALFSVMAVLDDTNLLHRGGEDGLAFVQTEARRFLDAGGVFDSRWRERALSLHRACIARRLSPGGAADMLAAACFLDWITV